MKKIINQKRYDTDTAKELGYYMPHGDRRNFNWYCETLYQKKTGEFFLYGEGGPMTRYAEKAGDNSWTSGEGITPLSYDQARDWAEEFLDAEEYESIFGEVSEGEEDGKQTISFSVPAAVAEQLKRLAAQTGKTQSDIIADLIREAQK